MKRSYVCALLGVVFCAVIIGCSRQSQEPHSASLGSIRIEHIPERGYSGNGNALIVARLEAPLEKESLQVVLHYMKEKTWLSEGMSIEKASVLHAEIPRQTIGSSVPYYFHLTTADGRQLLLPKDAPEESFQITFKGTVPRGLLFTHIVLMFGTILFLVIATVFGVRVLLNKETVGRCLLVTSLAVAVFFIGGFPFGMIVEKMVFGSWWEGWPFGRDVTDTKTFVLFIYWIFVLFGMKGSLRGKSLELNFFKEKTFCRLVIIGSIITILIYLIPHQNIKF